MRNNACAVPPARGTKGIPLYASPVSMLLILGAAATVGGFLTISRPRVPRPPPITPPPRRRPATDSRPDCDWATDARPGARPASRSASLTPPAAPMPPRRTRSSSSSTAPKRAPSSTASPPTSGAGPKTPMSPLVEASAHDEGYGAGPGGGRSRLRRRRPGRERRRGPGPEDYGSPSGRRPSRSARQDPARESLRRETPGIDARVGYFVTRFNPATRGAPPPSAARSPSLTAPSSRPAGLLRDKTVGPRDPEHGFTGKGHVFVDGHMELQSGGGCARWRRRFSTRPCWRT